ncbi:MAG: signal recognition particle-docking protein FtsY [Clostridia bacterium]|jgi:fused signal recognition particle receptor|nr:signal recognition particle-docking protein FtsY [Clostridia bacterium]MBQ1254960.1 signal recognition particle-docking protein FtsY [Clostridia bacterium]MBQ5791353.1 signal recognition particle-docking protein FtsY [Clostridia bacterium]
MGFFDKLKSGLKKTKDALLKPVDMLFASGDKVDDDFFEELTDLLIMADVGVETSEYIAETLRARLKEKKIKETEPAREEFRAILRELVGDGEDLTIGGNGVSVILVIGVNGVGKTTSIGKIANCLKQQGKKVMLCAADTFRAAAIEQLEVWANRSGVPLIKQKEGADPAAVVFDAAGAAKKQGVDVLIVDTAGRLHNKKNLIDELAKINRVISRELPDATRDTLLVLDASTGQNALVQAKEFRKAAEITGLVLTKLDGTAKGGIVLAIKRELGIPVKFIGVGEGIDDLQRFNGNEFIEAFFEG